jgi:hypothetical protein
MSDLSHFFPKMSSHPRSAPEWGVSGCKLLNLVQTLRSERAFCGSYHLRKCWRMERTNSYRRTEPTDANRTPKPMMTTAKAYELKV